MKRQKVPPSRFQSEFFATVPIKIDSSELGVISIILANAAHHKATVITRLSQIPFGDKCSPANQQVFVTLGWNFAFFVVVVGLPKMIKFMSHKVR